MSPAPQVELAALTALGPEWDALFDAGPGVQSRRAWFAATGAAALPDGTAARFVTVRGEAGPLGLLPLATGQGRPATSLTSPYSVLFQPLLAPGADAAAMGRVIGTALRAYPTLRLEALAPEWPGLDPWLSGLRQAGLLSARFDHFGNWSTDVSGLGWDGYLAARSGALRETIRRKGKAAARDASVRFEVVRDAAGLPGALAAYEAVYARSWKVPEPFPHFNAALLERLAPLGLMRLGILWQGDFPTAAQYWTVADGTATVLKLAHDEHARTLSPGTLLTAHMIRTLLDEGVRTLDFGRGDDPYKQQWTGTRHQRIGVLLANPWRPAGLMAIGRQWAGTLRRRFRTR